MFTNACKFYWGLVCSVGGGTQQIKGKLHGKGCLLSRNHAITALHTVTQMLHKYQWPVIMKQDGVFRCEVQFQSKEYDVALLRTTDKIVEYDLGPLPPNYPSIATSNPFLGLSVGFIGTISLEGENETERHTTFSPASTSYYFEEQVTKGFRYALIGGFVQKGFSGGPVFTCNSELVGLIVMAQRFALDMDNPIASLYNLPVMSPLSPLRKDIQAFLKTP